MVKRPKNTAAIDPDRLYRIKFSHSFEDAGGKKYIPRAGASVKVRGHILEQIKSEVDDYEAV